MSLEKTDWASSEMIFLGILISGEHHTLCVPLDKKIKTLNLLNWAKELKQYHHVSLDREFLLDCEVWVEFLNHSQEVALCRPFVDLSQTVTAKVF